MAFIVKKKVKGHDYFYLNKSVREAGKVKSKTLAYLGKTREEAESLEKKNIGYFAGYYDHETRMRVEQLYNCVHPIFGAAKDHIPTPKEAFEAGFKIGSTHLGKIQKEKR